MVAAQLAKSGTAVPDRELPASASRIKLIVLPATLEACFLLQ
jgi:hypothetical protein